MKRIDCRESLVAKKFIQTPDDKLFLLSEDSVYQLKLQHVLSPYQGEITLANFVKKSVRKSSGDLYFSVCSFRYEGLVVTGSMTKDLR